MPYETRVVVVATSCFNPELTKTNIIKDMIIEVESHYYAKYDGTLRTARCWSESMHCCCSGEGYRININMRPIPCGLTGCLCLASSASTVSQMSWRR